MNLLKIMTALCIILSGKVFSYSNQNFQKITLGELDSQYTIIVDKSFYQKFPDTFLVASSQELSLLFMPAFEMRKESFEYKKVLLKFYIIQNEDFKNSQIQFQEGILNGTLPIEICKNEDLVLVWNGETDIPNRIEDSKGNLLVEKYNEIIQKLNEYIDERDDKELSFNEFFSLELY